MTSLNRPSVSSELSSLRGRPTLPATAAAAIGSGGEISAPSAIAAPSGSAGINPAHAQATAPVVTSTKATASSMIVRRFARK